MLRRITVLQVLINGRYEGDIFFGIGVKCKV